MIGFAGWGGELARETSGSTTWYLSDRLGSVRGEYGTAATLTSKSSYEPFGQPQAGAGLSAPADYGFTGEPQADAPGGGLVQLRARWYAPGRGQFTARDPYAGRADQPRTLSNYEYSGSDPINNIDPSGLIFYGNRLPDNQLLAGQASQRVQLALGAAISLVVHAEVPIPGSAPPQQASNRSNMLRLDLLQEERGAIWEIKPLGDIKSATKVYGYVTLMNNARSLGIFGKAAFGSVSGILNDWNVYPAAWRPGLNQDHPLLNRVIFLVQPRGNTCWVGDGPHPAACGRHPSPSRRGEDTNPARTSATVY